NGYFALYVVLELCRQLSGIAAGEMGQVNRDGVSVASRSLDRGPKTIYLYIFSMKKSWWVALIYGKVTFIPVQVH
ncbi:MAG: hypothetical protein K2I09_02740, partial [Duncaniella sp.]|nr:hypothetical protein [Duncaniella sp.]